jgi:septum formation inhibitor MinC
MLSLIGTLFLGSAAFAQVSKTDSANKTISRKVLIEDVKDLPADAKSNELKGGVTQKGREKISIAEKQHYTIKMSNAANKAAADSAAKQKSSDYHIKMPSQKN